MKKILCIAESCCDVIFANMPHLPSPGEEVYGDGFAIRPGGGANTPINLGRLGADVTFLTGLGTDDMGRRILSELRSCGVRVRGRLRQPETRTAVSAVLSTAEDRSIASYAGTQVPFFTPYELEEEIRKADIVHTYLGYCVSHPIARLCETYGKDLCLDASWADAADSGENRRVLQSCAWLKVNQSEAVRLTGLADPVQALECLSGLVQKGVVITLGGEGSIGMAGGKTAARQRKLVRQEAVSRGVFRDACGAGDAYAAGLLWGLSQGKSLETGMRLGAILSGLCVTWLGGNSETLNCTIVRDDFCAN